MEKSDAIKSKPDRKNFNVYLSIKVSEAQTNRGRFSMLLGPLMQIIHNIFIWQIDEIKRVLR